MDLRLTDEEQGFRADVREWLHRQLPADLSHKVRHGLRLGRDDLQRWARLLGSQGWLASSWPVAFGGPGWSPLQRYLFEEECARAGAPRVLPFGPTMVAPVIMAYGTPAQQQRFLPGIASGETWWCQGYSEPGAGSDLASLSTRAERVGSHYVVRGQKTWTTLGQHADWIFCLVRTSTEGRPQAGISFLLIDMKSPGISVRPFALMDGELEVNDIFFDDVKVPADQLIGEENKGWTYAKVLLGHERTGIADVHRSQRELDRLKRIAQTEGLWDDLRFRDQIALLEVDIVALEMLVLRVMCGARDAPHKHLDLAALLKIRGSEIQQRYTELMMTAAGPFCLPWLPEALDAGWQGDWALGGLWPGGAAHCAPLAASYLNHRKTTIYGGSNEIQRNIVAQAVLGG